MLDSSKRNQSFWKLINYYWAAFFSIASPLIARLYGNNRLFKSKGLYVFTLENLRDVVCEISDSKLFGDKEIKTSYQGILAGCFDSVLTTNYTAFSQLFLKENATLPCIYLSGSLWDFKSIETLSTHDIREESIGAAEIVFPYLLTQVPIKPLIDRRQIIQYSNAVRALEQADKLFVLGYSLCENDTHILSLVRDYLIEGNGKKKLIYADYDGKLNPGEICKMLRAPDACACNIVVTKADSDSIKQFLK